MGKLFGYKEQCMKINRDEEVVIKGNYHDFDFTLQLRSESLDAWIPQDMSHLMSKYPESYQKILGKVEKYLLDQGDTDILLKGYGN